eukprot:TRINITY_DN29972_c0_g1_i1.p1 TRINITY_DN29972_c0_g1~~TRINITY_DN29972_c0_g1_i1.p1  ORF type:complete len:607 (+),score=266.49 TRINITY_DN29972_c0_g1_i1:132-1823(+)
MPPVKPSDSSHYDTLGLKRAASSDDIKRAYKQLALRHHPDRCEGSEEAFKRIAAAYEVLADDVRRSQYDRDLEQQSSRPRAVRQAYVTKCVDGQVKTFDVDPAALPGSLKHGDHIILTDSGQTGSVLGIADGQVWWWRAGESLASRAGSWGSFVSGQCRWRRTGNVFSGSATRERQEELRRRRMEELKKFRQKQADRARQERRAARLAAQLEAAEAKEAPARHLLQVLLLCQLQELHRRGAFVRRVAAYWAEVRVVGEDMMADRGRAGPPPPLRRPAAALCFRRRSDEHVDPSATYPPPQRPPSAPAERRQPSERRASLSAVSTGSRRHSSAGRTRRSPSVPTRRSEEPQQRRTPQRRLCSPSPVIRGGHAAPRAPDSAVRRHAEHRALSPDARTKSPLRSVPPTRLSGRSHTVAQSPPRLSAAWRRALSPAKQHCFGRQSSASEGSRRVSRASSPTTTSDDLCGDSFGRDSLLQQHRSFNRDTLFQQYRSFIQTTRQQPSVDDDSEDSAAARRSEPSPRPRRRAQPPLQRASPQRWHSPGKHARSVSSCARAQRPRMMAARP